MNIITSSEQCQFHLTSVWYFRKQSLSLLHRSVYTSVIDLENISRVSWHSDQNLAFFLMHTVQSRISYLYYYWGHYPSSGVRPWVSRFSPGLGQPAQSLLWTEATYQLLCMLHIDIEHWTLKNKSTPPLPPLLLPSANMIAKDHLLRPVDVDPLHKLVVVW